MISKNSIQDNKDVMIKLLVIMTIGSSCNGSRKMMMQLYSKIITIILVKNNIHESSNTNDSFKGKEYQNDNIDDRDNH